MVVAVVAPGTWRMNGQLASNSLGNPAVSASIAASAFAAGTYRETIGRNRTRWNDPLVCVADQVKDWIERTPVSPVASGNSSKVRSTSRCCCARPRA